VDQAIAKGKKLEATGTEDQSLAAGQVLSAGNNAYTVAHDKGLAGEGHIPPTIRNSEIGNKVIRGDGGSSNVQLPANLSLTPKIDP
jgi:hypothetical protein